MSTATATTTTAQTADAVPADQQMTAEPPAEQQAQAQAVAAVVVQLDPAQVAQHRGNIRDASRGIKELTGSVAEVGVLVPLIVVPVALVPSYDGPRR